MNGFSDDELKASQSKFTTLHTVSILMGTKAEKVNRMGSTVTTGHERRLNQNERLIFSSHFMLCSCSLINDPIFLCQNFTIKWHWAYDGKFRSEDKEQRNKFFKNFLYENDLKSFLF
jgi:hypothetical protein